MITVLSRKNAETAYFSWVPLTLEQLRGFLNTYEVIYQKMNKYECPEIEPEFRQTLSVKTNSVVIRNLDPLIEYCVGVSASTAAGGGNYSYQHLPCKTYLST